MTEQKKRLRIVFISHSGFLTGADRVLFNTVMRLDRERFEPVVLIPEGAPMENLLKGRGVRTLPFSSPWLIHVPEHLEDYALSTRRAVDRAEALFARLQPDVVVSSTTVHLAALAAAVRLRIPALLHIHGVFSEILLPGQDYRIYRRLEELAVGMASRVVYVSEWTRKFFESAYGQLPSAVVPNGCEAPNTFLPLKKEIEPPFRFVMLCTLEANKGIEHVVRAGDLLRKKSSCPSFEVHVYGQGDEAYLQELREKIQKSGLAKTILLKEKVADTGPVYQDAFAAIVASEIESFSMICIEAMAHCRPVIATRCGGPEGILEGEQAGLLVDRGNPEELARAMEKLMADPEQAAGMGRKGRKIFEGKYEIRKVLARFEEQLDEVLDQEKQDAMRRREQSARQLEVVLGSWCEAGRREGKVRTLRIEPVFPDGKPEDRLLLYSVSSDLEGDWDLSSVDVPRGWERKHNPHLKVDYLRTVSPDAQPLYLSGRGEVFSLRFLQHADGGYANVESDGLPVACLSLQTTQPGGEWLDYSWEARSVEQQGVERLKNDLERSRLETRIYSAEVDLQLQSAACALQYASLAEISLPEKETDRQQERSPNWLVVCGIYPSNPTCHLTLGKTVLELNRQGKINLRMLFCTDAGPNDVLWSDVVVFVRSRFPSELALLELAQKLGRKTFYCTDDALCLVPRPSLGGEIFHFPDSRRVMQRLSVEPDALLVVNPRTGQAYREEWGVESVRPIRPVFETPSKLPPAGKGQTLLIGCAGSEEYGKRLMEIAQTLIALKQKWGEKIHFEFFGMKPAVAAVLNATVLPQAPYEEYEKKLLERRWDIGLCRLADSRFDNCKYVNKYMEYGRLGIAGVYSAIPLYRDFVENEKTGLLVENEPDAWFEAVERMIEDGPLRQRIRQEAYQDIRRKFTLHPAVEFFEEVMQDALEFKASRYKEFEPEYREEAVRESTAVAVSPASAEKDLEQMASGRGWPPKEPPALESREDVSRKSEALWRSAVARGVKPSPPLRPRRIYRIAVDRPRWNGIAVLAGTHARPCGGWLTMEIRDKNRDVLREVHCPLDGTKDNQALFLGFRCIPNTTGGVYTLEFRAEYSDEDSMLSLYEYPGLRPGLWQRMQNRLVQRGGQLFCELDYE
jgi:glycosyltransferase involved in cell wall biosynthesis